MLFSMLNVFGFSLISTGTTLFEFNDVEAWDIVSKTTLRPNTHTLTLASFYDL